MNALANAASFVAVLGLASAAQAHIAVQPSTAAPGAAETLNFMVGHGCSGQPTTALRVEMPKAVSDVEPQPKAGWTLAVEKLPDGGRAVIPYGLTPLFLGAAERAEAPPPRALFLSNPLRSLDWLLDLWAADIHPRMPAAELHIFAGIAIYGTAGAAKADRMTPILDRAASMAGDGVVLRGPVPKADLAREMTQARILL